MSLDGSIYAIIATGGKQYRVGVGSSLIVEKVPGDADSGVVFYSVLLLGDEQNIVIGKPNIEGASVEAKVKSQVKGAKKIAFRYKNKTRGGVKRGHRQQLTELTITAINTPKSSKVEGNGS